jgi:hypothetical protein
MFIVDRKNGVVCAHVLIVSVLSNAVRSVLGSGSV